MGVPRGERAVPLPGGAVPPGHPVAGRRVPPQVGRRRRDQREDTKAQENLCLSQLTRNSKPVPKRPQRPNKPSMTQYKCVHKCCNYVLESLEQYLSREMYYVLLLGKYLLSKLLFLLLIALHYEGLRYRGSQQTA